ncbi:hypothetical protein, partial [Thiolapillus sp.]
RHVRRPTLFSLWRKARRENSAASRLLGSTSLRFALHGWQRWLTALRLSLRKTTTIRFVVREPGPPCDFRRPCYPSPAISLLYGSALICG